MKSDKTNGIIALIFIIAAIVMAFYISWVSMICSAIALLISISGVMKGQGVFPVVTLIGAFLILAFQLISMFASSNSNVSGKEEFCNTVLSYVESLKSQVTLSAKGSGYSTLQIGTRRDIDDTNDFYAPTSDMTEVRVTVSDMNEYVMDDDVLTRGSFYVKWVEDGYEYYIKDLEISGKYRIAKDKKININEFNEDMIEEIE